MMEEHPFEEIRKSDAFAPTMVALLTSRGTFPVLASVTDCATEEVPTFWARYVRLSGDTRAEGISPKPLRTEVSGEPGSSPTTVRVPFLAPGWVGVKST